MPIKVAEYLGQRTDIDDPIIQPCLKKGKYSCPFMNSTCDKVKTGYSPICSVRKTSGELWLTCRHRLCSSRDVSLTDHQITVLSAAANLIYKEQTALEEILIKREEHMQVTSRSKYLADYVMIRKVNNQIDPVKVIIEMQGGGETSNTGLLSQHIKRWEANTAYSNKILSEPIQKVGTLETNAWRRQQEQFIVKGNIVSQTGGKIVFCVGSPLFDYLMEKINVSTLKNLRDHNWTLAIFCFDEDSKRPVQPGPVPLKINQEKILFTNYRTFVDNLTNQGNPAPKIFLGNFLGLDGKNNFI
jgi:hypothetical protein